MFSNVKRFLLNLFVLTQFLLFQMTVAYGVGESEPHLVNVRWSTSAEVVKIIEESSQSDLVITKIDSSSAQFRGVAKFFVEGLFLVSGLLDLITLVNHDFSTNDNSSPGGIIIDARKEELVVSNDSSLIAGHIMLVTNEGVRIFGPEETPALKLLLDSHANG